MKKQNKPFYICYSEKLSPPRIWITNNPWLYTYAWVVGGPYRTRYQANKNIPDARLTIAIHNFRRAFRRMILCYQSFIDNPPHV